MSWWRHLCPDVHMHVQKSTAVTIGYSHLNMCEVLWLRHLAANHLLGHRRGRAPFSFRDILWPISVYAPYMTRSNPFDALRTRVSACPWIFIMECIQHEYVHPCGKSVAYSMMIEWCVTNHVSGQIQWHAQNPCASKLWALLASCTWGSRKSPKPREYIYIYIYIYIYMYIYIYLRACECLQRHQDSQMCTSVAAFTCSCGSMSNGQRLQLQRIAPFWMDMESDGRPSFAHVATTENENARS